jgi:hypothetical protein
VGRTKRTVRTASFVNDFNDLHQVTPYEAISLRPIVLSTSTPQTQKNKDDSNLKFHNDFKGLHIDLNVVVDLDYSSVVSLLIPPNPSYAIVVADLLIPLVDYSSVVIRVQE